MIADCQTDVLKIVEQQQPVSILAIGPDAATVFAAYLNSHPECRFNTVAGQDVGEHRGTLGGYTIPRLSRTRLGVHG